MGKFEFFLKFVFRSKKYGFILFFGKMNITSQMFFTNYFTFFGSSGFERQN